MSDFEDKLFALTQGAEGTKLTKERLFKNVDKCDEHDFKRPHEDPNIQEEPPYTPTLGERRVRANFNPSSLGSVAHLKNMAVEFIDCCDHQLKKATDPEEKRLWSLAMTHIEDAAMWAVKAATFNK